MYDEGFWNWWAGARGDVDRALDVGHDDPLVHELLDRVGALGLEGEVGPGLHAKHMVCASCGGEPARRKAAYLWLAGSPPADDVFEFHASRKATPNAARMVLRLGDEEFAQSELRFVVSEDPDRRELDLVVHHPSFAGMTDEGRGQVGFLALDSLLGEEGVERWIGDIEWDVDAAPPDALAPQELVPAVARFEAQPADDHWVLMQGTGPDDVPVMVSAARPLKPVDHPLFDELVELVADVPADEDGNLTLGPLQELEDELQERFAGDVFHAASLTSDGVRRTFVFADGDGAAAPALAAWASENGYEVTRTRDPAWDAVRPFR